MKKKALALLQDNKRVSPFKRAFGYFIDGYILMMSCSAPILYYRSLGAKTIDMNISLSGFSEIESMIFMGISLLLSFLYLVVLPKKTGQTLGKKLMKFKIISTDGKELGYKQLFIRGMIGIVLIEGTLLTSSLLLQEFIVQTFKINHTVFSFYPMIVTLSIMYSFFNKDQRMIHDVIAKTKVIRIK